MAAWCAGQDPWALAKRLRDAGVPASVCLRPLDLYEDAQLAHRQSLVEVAVPGLDEPLRMPGLPYRYREFDADGVALEPLETPQ